ncbi:Protein VAC14-like protein [Hibiscus syriacus]|uniref:Protein VAC14-like protein n=1 Tax=Hibiscus syriacus TaxID=106335 RepID=A0A6A2YS30_HIBSY|nr:Protein VAC14-like protein [Hibiscus syriacus]
MARFGGSGDCVAPRWFGRWLYSHYQRLLRAGGARILDIHACIAQDPLHFRRLAVFLMHNFRVDGSLLERRGALIIRRLCVLLDAERVYRELSTILEGEADLDFACAMVQALNLILLTSSELSDLRELLKQSLVNAAGKDLFVSFYAPWCHSPMAIVSLCLLAQTYQHACAVIQSLVEEDINAKLLIQLDKLIRLLEAPIFAYLRLQLLEPRRYIWLLKALYGLLMVLPQQSAAFKILRRRLKTVPSNSVNDDQLKRTSSGNHYSPILNHSGSKITEDGDMDQDNGNLQNGFDFASLQQFKKIQQQHHMLAKSRAQLRDSSTSLLKFNVDMSMCPTWICSSEYQIRVHARHEMVPKAESQQSPTSETNKPPSRSSRRGLGSLADLTCS